METKDEEENKAKKHNLIAATPDWLDLPEPIATNIILEHLDVVDYIRFSAVCKRWQSIQKGHQILYSPHPPPSPIPFPWLRCSNCLYNYNQEKAIHFYVPDKQKSYNIPFYKTPKRVKALGFAYGWLLFLLNFDKYYSSFCIFNPITGVQIELPLFKSEFYAADISSPPADPDCTIVLLDYDDYIYLYRLHDNSSLIKTDYSINNLCRPYFCHNKIYYMVGYDKIHMVDVLLPEPVEQMIEMDISEICVGIRRGTFHLVDFLGELVMIIVGYENFLGVSYNDVKEFYVYRADFRRNKWVKMESLGDHVLFFSYDRIFSLPAVEVGCKKNSIYLVEGLNGRGVAWRAFDISTKNWVDGPPMSLPCNKCHSFDIWSWFLPIIDYYSVAKRNGACRIQLK